MPMNSSIKKIFGESMFLKKGNTLSGPADVAK